MRSERRWNTHNRNFGKPNPRMARPANESAKKSPPWLPEYDLDTFKGVDAFTKELLKLTWTGSLGTRQSSDCLAILRLLLERRLWLPTSSDRFNPEISRFGQPSPEKGNSTTQPEPDLPEMNLSSPEECEQMKQYITTLLAEGRLTSKQTQVMFQAVDNALQVLKLQEGKTVNGT